MSVRAVAWVLVGVLVSLGLAGATHADTLAPMVADIAAPQETSPQPVPPSAPAADLTLLLIAVALAATSVVIIRRARLHRFTTVRPVSSDRLTDTWMILLIAGLLVWLANALGGASAYQVLVNAAPTDPLSLRTMALLSLGGAIGALIALAILPLILPGVFGHIGLRGRPRDGLVALAAFALICPLIIVLNVLMRVVANLVNTSRGLAPPDEIMHDTLALMVDAPFGPWWWLLVGLTTIATPIYEEVLFRGFIQTALLRRTASPAAAILATSAIFAVIHLPVVEWHGLPGLFLLSLALGVAMERTGRLGAPILLHALFNGVNIAVALGAG